MPNPERERADRRAKAFRVATASALPCPRALLLPALALALLPWSQAKSQVTLDVSKITCDQFTGYKITSPNNIALWLHGYFNGQKNNTIMDTQRLKADSNRLLHYCLAKPDIPVMDAVKKVFRANR
jgi:hypothetical protein